MVSGRKKVLGVAALTAAAAVGAAKFGSRRSTGEIITITPGKEMALGDMIEVRDLKSRSLTPIKLSVPYGTGQDFAVGEKVGFHVDRNPRHKVNGLPPGSLTKLS